MASKPVATERNLFNADHGAGKGDKERSSKWRANYADIDWGILAMQFDEQKGGRLIKKYPTLAKCEPWKPDPCPHCPHQYVRNLGQQDGARLVECESCGSRFLV